MVKEVIKPNNSNASFNRKNLTKAIKITWFQFSTRTSIHGVKYISDKKGTVFTRILWIGICIVCFVVANILVSTFWTRYKSNPTRMNIETNHGSLEEMPFPAITFCSTNRISFIKALKLVNSLNLPENVTRNEMLYYLKQSSGFTQKIDYNPVELELLQEIMTTNRYDATTAMEDLKISCKEFLYRCRWEGKITECTKLFKKAINYDGHCCSFNYADSNKQEYTARRAKLFGLGNGLSVVLTPMIEPTAISNTYSEGVKLLVHESNTYPSDSSTEKMLPIQSESMASIRPSVTVCSNTVKALPIKDRECVFNDEQSLNYFARYRGINCDVECRMTKTLTLCGCLPYYYPNSQNIAICNFTKIECLVDHFAELRSSTGIDNKTECACPANCNGIFYDVHTDTSPLVYSNLSIDPFYKGINESHMVVHIFLNSQVFQKMRRDLLTNIVSLISNFGGVYSLFVGMSVIGFLEILYFTFIRLYKNYVIIKNETINNNKNIITKEEATNIRGRTIRKFKSGEVIKHI